MATFNGQLYLEEQINSIVTAIEYAKRTHKLIVRLIFVDDGSTDETLSILNNVEKKYQVQTSIYINLNNQGHVRAFERALSYATGDLILLSDQDDIWTEDHILVFLENMPREGECIAFAGVKMFRDDKVMESFVFPSKSVSRFVDLVLLFAGRMPVWGCTSCMTQSFLQKHLPFPKVVEAHDIYLALSGILHNEIIFLDHLVVLRRMHDKNITPRRRRPIFLIVKSRLKLLCIIFHSCIKFIKCK